MYIFIDMVLKKRGISLEDRNNFTLSARIEHETMKHGNHGDVAAAHPG